MIVGYIATVLPAYLLLPLPPTTEMMISVLEEGDDGKWTQNRMMIIP